MKKTSVHKKSSESGKDALILVLKEQIKVLQEQLKEQQEQNQLLQQMVQKLNQTVVDLQSRLNLNSQNSSKPPSSDGLNRPKPKSLRQAGQRPTGGQPGHTGMTLSRSADPDTIITHDVPEKCDACQSVLKRKSVAQSRQVFDLPTQRFEVIEHRVIQAICTCGKTHIGQFPANVSASLQYGPKAQAAMVHLNQYHMLPLQRTAGIMGDIFGLPVSAATVMKACVDAKAYLMPTVQAIAAALQTAPVAHADETGMRVAKTLGWLHVVVTDTLTWMGHHAKRGAVAFNELGILGNFKGTLIHDGWKPYRTLDCTHGLCNAHHLRELTYLHEEQKQEWAKDMIDLLTYANSQIQTLLPNYRVGHMRYAYEEILNQAEISNPPAISSGKPGRVKQTKAVNLIRRLREDADDVWRFMTDPNIPFTNNLAEQAVRMPKVKQKVSGCFRTNEGIDIFCVIRSYLATMHKQGANLFDSLVATFQGATPQPLFP